MIKALLELLSMPIFSEVVINQFFKASHKFKYSLKKVVFEYRMRKYISGYCMRHDNTILWTSAFARYLKYQKPLISICQYAFGASDKTVPTNEFVEELIRECQDSVKGPGEKFVFSDRAAIKELFNCIIKRYVYFVKQNFPNEINVAQVEIMRHETEQFQKLKNDLPQEVANALKPLIETTVLSDETVEHAYTVLSTELFAGHIEIVRTIRPLIAGRSSDLENALYILLGLITDEPIDIHKEINRLRKISNSLIQTDLVRKIIVLNLNDTILFQEMYSTLPSLPSQVKSIIQDLINHNFSNMFLEKKTKKGGMIKTLEEKATYSEEKQLVKQILFMYICNLNSVTKYCLLEQVSRGLIDKKTNVIIQLFMWNAFINEIDVHCSSQKTNIPKEKYKEITNAKLGYEHLNQRYTQMYWETVLLYAMNLEPSEIKSTYYEAPSWVREISNIKKFYLYARICDGDIDEDTLVDFCHKNQDFDLLIEYMKGWVNNPKKIIDFLEDKKYILSRNCSMLCFYAEAVRLVCGNESSLQVLKKYESKYKSELLYLVVIYYANPCSENANNLLTLYNNGECAPISFSLKDELVDILTDNQRYSEALQIIQQDEKLGYVSCKSQKAKACILRQQGKYISALNIYSHLFDNGMKTDDIVTQILALSLQSERSVGKTVLEKATASQHSTTLILASEVYFKENKMEQSKSIATRALLKAPNPVAAMQYWKIVHFCCNTTEMPSCIDLNTAVVLKENNCEKLRTYCIYENSMLSEESIEWGETIHISLDTAIIDGMLRKKKGDHLTLDTTDYTVEQIIPIEKFLSQKSIEILRENHSVQEFSFDPQKTDEQNLEGIVQWIDSYVEKQRENSLIEKYRNLEQEPAPFYALSKEKGFSYEQFVVMLLADNNIIVRNQKYIPSNKYHKGYILSFSELVTLYKIGISVKTLKDHDVVIPNSMVNLAKSEANDTIRTKNQEDVAMIGTNNGHLDVSIENEDEKRQWMKDTVKIRDYAEQFATFENHNDIEVDGIRSDKLMELFGIADCDAISIAINLNRCVISDEPMILAFSQFPELNVPVINTLDFLVKIKFLPLELIEVMVKLIHLKFLMPINKCVVDYLSKCYLAMGKKEKKILSDRWIQYLLLLETIDASYKKMVIYVLEDIIDQKSSDTSEVALPIWEPLLSCYMKMKKLSWVVGRDENGNYKVEIQHNTSTS